MAYRYSPRHVFPKGDADLYRHHRKVRRAFSEVDQIWKAFRGCLSFCFLRESLKYFLRETSFLAQGTMVSRTCLPAAHHFRCDFNVCQLSNWFQSGGDATSPKRHRVRTKPWQRYAVESGNSSAAKLFALAALRPQVTHGGNLRERFVPWAPSLSLSVWPVSTAILVNDIFAAK